MFLLFLRIYLLLLSNNQNNFLFKRKLFISLVFNESALINSVKNILEIIFFSHKIIFERNVITWVSPPNEYLLAFKVSRFRFLNYFIWILLS